MNKNRLAQAKTGTGKTLAFLVPVVQNILRDENLLNRVRAPRSSAADIRSVIISPTRELAEQIAVEAKKMLRSTGVVVQSAVGGTRKREGLQRIQREGCHILVGTPGRLIDIFSDPTSGVSAPKMSSFVLDEADRLLDIGFAPDIQRLQEYFPDRSQVDRQTLMFSATIPREVQRLVRTIMKPDFSYINTIGEETPTHLKVPQKAVFLKGFENQLPAIYELSKRAILDHVKDPVKHSPFKAIVYYNSTAEVMLARQAFVSLRRELNMLDPDGSNLQMTEMHARLTQAQRTFSSEAFRRLKSGILFSSDVTARGMDFPDVTHVIQVGIPQNRESYIHRLGRTARANKTGEGWILLTDPEFPLFKQRLTRLPIEEDTSLQSAMADLTNPSQIPESLAAPYSQLCQSFANIDGHNKANVARILTGQLARDSRLDKREMHRLIKRQSTSLWGLDEVPRMVEQDSGSRFGGGSGSRFGRSNPREERGGFGNMRDRSSGFGGGFNRSDNTNSRGRREPFQKRSNSWEGRGRSNSSRF